MFPWSDRTTHAVESGPLPPIDLSAPVVIETATFATG